MQRVGIGVDAHRLAAGRDLILGGVKIPHTHGLEGHSDADVLAHAVCDALLGAGARGDIGVHFPDDDEKYKNASGEFLLRRTAQIVTAKIVNIDAVIIAQQPRLQPFIGEMRQNIAAALNIQQERAGVKATTTEYMGFVGRREGIAAVAVAMIDDGE